MKCNLIVSAANFHVSQIKTILHFSAVLIHLVWKAVGLIYRIGTINNEI